MVCFAGRHYQNQAIELQPNGVGSGQLHRFYESIELGAYGAMLVQAFSHDNQANGLLFVAESEGINEISQIDRELMPALTNFLGSALVRRPEWIPDRVEIVPDGAETAVSGRVIALEESRKKLEEQLEITQNRLQQAEKRAAAAGKRAHDLAATLEEIEKVNQDDRVSALEQEVETLRESLIEAEEAMALASAGEGGLSSEWVMLTITRYSGQLEEAQSRIEALERQLLQLDDDAEDPVMISLVQELRTPMTSISGFTDLMLAETVGILGVRQRDLLKRVQANNERMGALLDQIVLHVTKDASTHAELEDKIDVREVLETAVSSVITQVREKRLNLDMNIAEDLAAIGCESTGIASGNAQFAWKCLSSHGCRWAYYHFGFGQFCAGWPRCVGRKL